MLTNIPLHNPAKKQSKYEFLVTFIDVSCNA